MKNTYTHLVAEGLERLERAEAVLERLGGDAEHADHGEAAVLELGGLELEDGGVVGGGGEAEGVEVAAGVAALVGVELCDHDERGRIIRSVGRSNIIIFIVEILFRRRG